MVMSRKIERRELGLGEVLGGRVVDLVGDAVVGDLGHLLDEGQRRALALVEEVAGLAPAGDDVQALGPLAAGDRVAAVHVHAVGAAVHLRDAELEELLQLRIEAGLADGAVEAQHRAVELGRGLFDVDA